MEKTRVLFICIHNSARSQMAEEYLKKFGGEKYVAESAGYRPGEINPLVIEVLKEEGIDISAKKTNSVLGNILMKDVSTTMLSLSAAGLKKNVLFFQE